jgi:uncharacterized coiled-coil protein SlyX
MTPGTGEEQTEGPPQQPPTDTERIATLEHQVVGLNVDIADLHSQVTSLFNRFRELRDGVVARPEERR